jgi:hypothetical protein
VTLPTTFSHLPMASGGVVGCACAYCPGVGDPARRIAGDDVMAAVRPGQDQIGAQALVLAAKQQFRV